MAWIYRHTTITRAWHGSIDIRITRAWHGSIDVRITRAHKAPREILVVALPAVVDLTEGTGDMVASSGELHRATTSRAWLGDGIDQVSREPLFGLNACKIVGT